MAETKSLTDSVIAAAFAASPLPDGAIDSFLNRYKLCLEALKGRREAEEKAAAALAAAARRPRKSNRQRRGSAMTA
jgi:hypothetical protein